MNRTLPRIAIALVAAALLGGVLGVGGPLLAQEEEPAPVVEEEPIFAAPIVEFALGERWETAAWDMDVQDVFTAPSPLRPGHTEVRIAIALQNRGDPFPYLRDGFVGTIDYPQISLVDSEGTLYPYVLTRDGQTAVSGAWLINIGQELTGRWTVGFQVPTAFDDDLTLVVQGAAGNAAWDLSTSAISEAWEPPEVETTAMNDTVQWSEALEVTPVTHGSLLCGDPERQIVTYIYTLVVDIENTGVTDAQFPGVRYPDAPVVAQWANGAAAGATSETYVGTESLINWAEDAVIIPPGPTTHRRALMFGVPRDGRLGSVNDGPTGALLNRPEGQPLWLEITGADGIEINPQFCDFGQLSGPIPYAFGPGPGFDVATVDLGIDNATADRAAVELLGEARVIVGNYVAVNEDYVALTAADLEAIWSGIDFANGFAFGGRNVVGVEPGSDGLELAMSTQSESGRWFCITLNDEASQTSVGSGPTVGFVAEACIPAEEEAPVVEGEVEGEAEVVAEVDSVL
jgi:hypothetical protein